MTAKGGRYCSLQLQPFSYPLQGMGALRSSFHLPVPVQSPSSSLLQSPPPCQLLTARGGVKPGESTVSRCCCHSCFTTYLLESCGTHAAVISQPPTSNLCISKPSVARARPTHRIGSAQLVITDHSSSETSHFSVFRGKKNESQGGWCVLLESCDYKLAITPVTAVDLIEVNFWSKKVSQLNYLLFSQIIVRCDETNS